MTFCLFTSFDKPYKMVSDYTLPVLMEFCDRWNHELVVRQNPCHPKGIIWGRINAMLSYDGNADWLVHMDGDVLITNLNVSLQILVHLAKDETGFDPLIIVGTDHNGINDGILFVRNSPAGRSKVGELYHTYYDCFQTALASHLEENRNVVAVPHQRLFNSYVPDEYPEQDKKGQWEPKDFAVHMPGRSNERRVELLKHYTKQIER